MLAARCHTYGPPDVVVVEEVPDPLAGEGQVVVDVAAAAVNFPDVLLVADKYQITVPLPFIPGSELAGMVRSLGPGVTSLAVGDRVVGASLVGAFAQQIALPATSLVSVPDSVELDVAAAAGVAHRTAYHALRTMGKVRAEDNVVVLGAAGGVGLAAVELAVVLGAKVTAVASSESKRALCLAKGAHTAVDSGAPDLKEQLRSATGGGSDVVVDPVGGPYAEEALRAMRWGGRFVSVGFASGEIPRIPLNLVLLKGVHVTGFTMAGIATNQPVETARDNAELSELLATGKVVPHVSARYPLSQTAQALADLAERRATGKVLVLPYV
jgi:NADPH2:quinone reductase